MGKTKEEAENDLLPTSGPAVLATHTLTPLAPHAASSWSIFRRTVLAELRLMLQGRPAVGLVVAAGLIIAGLLSDTAFARRWLLPCAWIWPLTPWSAMGTREAQHATENVTPAHLLITTILMLLAFLGRTWRARTWDI